MPSKTKDVNGLNPYSLKISPIDVVHTPCQETDPEIFFPHDGDAQGVKMAKSLCARCNKDSFNKCLAFAITNHIKYGIWGGLTPGERRSIVRRNARAKETKGLEW
jgi:WhiB family redox-sensing transcriptional regulator